MGLAVFGYALGAPRSWRAEWSDGENCDDAPWSVDTHWVSPDGCDGGGAAASDTDTGGRDGGGGGLDGCVHCRSNDFGGGAAVCAEWP